MGVIIKELVALYSMPERFYIELADMELFGDEPWVHVKRTENAIELIADWRADENSHPVNIIIPVTEEAMEMLVEINAELVRLRAPFLTQYQLHRAVAWRIDQRTQPTLCRAMMQQLPLGERLSIAAIGASVRTAERLYAAVDNLEQAMSICGVRFDSLRPEDLIVGIDGRLYPFRYDNIYFEVDDQDRIVAAEPPLEECQQLRKEIEELCSHAPQQSHYPTETNPYSSSLSDIYGGYIYCREPHEGLIAVEDMDGWGFVDEMHSVVVEPKYLSVSDFKGGFAVVQIAEDELYGLIDRRGRFILEPIYTLLEVDKSSGDITIELGGKRSIVCKDELKLRGTELDIL
ncbi:MAG: WG repeat-containing protein [Rikenellaceae bacterium]